MFETTDLKPGHLQEIAAMHSIAETKRTNHDELLKLPEGQTCGDCYHFRRCQMLFMCKAQWTTCDFYPVRFVPAGPDTAVPQGAD